MTKVVNCILSVDTIEQKIALLKRVLQSPRLKYNVKILLFTNQ